MGWNIGFKDRLKIILIRFQNLVLGQDTASPQDLFSAINLIQNH